MSTDLSTAQTRVLDELRAPSGPLPAETPSSFVSVAAEYQSLRKKAAKYKYPPTGWPESARQASAAMGYRIDAVLAELNRLPFGTKLSRAKFDALLDRHQATDAHYAELRSEGASNAQALQQATIALRGALATIDKQAEIIKVYETHLNQAKGS